MIRKKFVIRHEPPAKTEASIRQLVKQYAAEGVIYPNDWERFPKRLRSKVSAVSSFSQIYELRGTTIASFYIHRKEWKKMKHTKNLTIVATHTGGVFSACMQDIQVEISDTSQKVFQVTIKSENATVTKG